MRKCLHIYMFIYQDSSWSSSKWSHLAWLLPCRRLAAEGLVEHVERITVGLAQVLCSMTRAMSAATQAAVQAEAHVSGESVRTRECVHACVCILCEWGVCVY